MQPPAICDQDFLNNCNAAKLHNLENMPKCCVFPYTLRTPIAT